MNTDSLTRVGVKVKEYIEQRRGEKRRDGSGENERGRTRREGVRKHGGKVQGKGKRRRKKDLRETGD